MTRPQKVVLRWLKRLEPTHLKVPQRILGVACFGPQTPPLELQRLFVPQIGHFWGIHQFTELALMPTPIGTAPHRTLSFDGLHEIMYCLEWLRRTERLTMSRSIERCCNQTRMNASRTPDSMQECSGQLEAVSSHLFIPTMYDSQYCELLVLRK
jgi:hypothetical protein